MTTECKLEYIYTVLYYDPIIIRVSVFVIHLYCVLDLVKISISVFVM